MFWFQNYSRAIFSLRLDYGGDGGGGGGSNGDVTYTYTYAVYAFIGLFCPVPTRNFLCIFLISFKTV